MTLVKTDDSEVRIISIMNVRRISEPETSVAVTSNCSTRRRIIHYIRMGIIEWDIHLGGRKIVDGIRLQDKANSAA